MNEALAGADIGAVWGWLGEIPDPEIPALSIVDLGIVRGVRWADLDGRRELIVTITPTYSGCPAMTAIGLAIESELRARGVAVYRLERRLAPPWTTDWISDAGRRRLAASGIAPPAGSATPHIRGARQSRIIACPRCGSENTIRVSAFGSTPCKAQYRCADCLEPFDYFKCI